MEHREPHKIITPEELKAERTFKRGDRVRYCRMFLRSKTELGKKSSVWKTVGTVRSARATMKGTQSCVVQFNKPVGRVFEWNMNLESAD